MAPKWAARFQPYANVINNVVSTLPARVPGQPTQNVMNRVAPIAEALYNARISGATTR